MSLYVTLQPPRPCVLDRHGRHRRGRPAAAAPRDTGHRRLTVSPTISPLATGAGSTRLNGFHWVGIDPAGQRHYATSDDTRCHERVWAHNPEVTGSNPVPATRDQQVKRGPGRSGTLLRGVGSIRILASAHGADVARSTAAGGTGPARRDPRRPTRSWGRPCAPPPPAASSSPGPAPRSIRPSRRPTRDLDPDRPSTR